MPFVSLTLAAVAQMCAPRVAPRTTLAIMQVESSGRPWTINDNDSGKAYYEPSKSAAVSLAQELLAQGHNIDMGLMQVNSSHLPTLGMSVETLLDPCVNVAVGSDILRDAYRHAVDKYGPSETALVQAFEIYNSGRSNGAPRYARLVWDAGVSLARSGW